MAQLNPGQAPAIIHGMGSVKRIQEREEATLCLALGYTQVETARRVGVHYSTIRDWLKEPAFRKRLDKLRKQQEAEIPRRLKDIRTRALDQVIRLHERASNEQVRLKASQDLLDRAGVVHQPSGSDLAAACEAIFGDDS